MDVGHPSLLTVLRTVCRRGAQYWAGITSVERDSMLPREEILGGQGDRGGRDNLEPLFGRRSPCEREKGSSERSGRTVRVEKKKGSISSGRPPRRGTRR